MIDNPSDIPNINIAQGTHDNARHLVERLYDTTGDPRAKALEIEDALAELQALSPTPELNALILEARLIRIYYFLERTPFRFDTDTATATVINDLIDEFAATLNTGINHIREADHETLIRINQLQRSFYAHMDIIARGIDDNLLEEVDPEYFLGTWEGLLQRIIDIRESLASYVPGEEEMNQHLLAAVEYYSLGTIQKQLAGLADDPTQPAPLAKLTQAASSMELAQAQIKTLSTDSPDPFAGTKQELHFRSLRSQIPFELGNTAIVLAEFYEFLHRTAVDDSHPQEEWQGILARGMKSLLELYEDPEQLKGLSKPQLIVLEYRLGFGYYLFGDMELASDHLEASIHRSRQLPAEVLTAANLQDTIDRSHDILRLIS